MVVVSRTCQPIKQILLAMQSVPVHSFVGKTQAVSMMQTLSLRAEQDFSHPARREKYHVTICVRVLDLSARRAHYVLREMDEI